MIEGSNPYDEVPYQSQAFPQTHPDRLATIATLFGLNPPPVDRCRVLELGCAGGGNLIPMAFHIPDGHFLGVDLSRREVEDAWSSIAALGLANIRIEHASILDVTSDWGEFDYIICHGVYSWVEMEVQDRILQIVASQLAPDGVAYVSYNTYPGWHMRESIRHMMRYHADPFDEPAERIAQARALLDFLATSVPPESGAYGQLLHGEVELLRQCPDPYIYHDHLERTNSPLYFHQFMARAESYRLQYLAEADLSVMLTGRFPAPVAETLERISPDILHLEQYMDFVRNRHFRQTLLCGSAHQLKRSLGPWNLEHLAVSAPLKAVGGSMDPEPRAPKLFLGCAGLQITSDRPATKAALSLLGEHWPRPIQAQKLAERALERAQIRLASDAEDDRRAILEDLFRCAVSGAIELHTWMPPCTAEVSERPRAHPLAAYQASQGPLVVNARHETVALNGLERELIGLLDGHRTRREIIGALEDRVASGQLRLQNADPEVQPKQPPTSAVAAAAEAALASFAQKALLAR